MLHANELPFDVGTDSGVDLLQDLVLLMVVGDTERVNIRRMVTEIVSSSAKATIYIFKLFQR